MDFLLAVIAVFLLFFIPSYLIMREAIKLGVDPYKIEMTFIFLPIFNIVYCLWIYDDGRKLAGKSFDRHKFFLLKKKQK